MRGSIITTTIGSGRRHLSTAIVGETVGTAATAAAAAASSALITSSYLITKNTVGATDTTSPETTAVPPATTSVPTIVPWQHKLTPRMATPITKSVRYGPARPVGLR